MNRYTIEEPDFFSIAETPTSEEVKEEKIAIDNKPYRYRIDDRADIDLFGSNVKSKPRQTFQSVYEFENDEDVLKDWDIVANAINENGEGIAETLRDTDFNLTSAMVRAGQTNQFTQQEKDAYNRLRTKFANTKLKGFYEYFELIGNATVDTVLDPFTLVALVAAPFTGGTSLAAKQAAATAVLQGSKRYALAKSIQATATKPVTYTTLEGAAWNGLHNYYNQDIDVDLGNRDNIDWKEVGTSSAIGGGVGLGLGAGVGLYSGAKYYNRLQRYHNEDSILKYIDGLDKEAVKSVDEVTGANKKFYEGKKSIGGKTASEWVDYTISRLPMFGKATTEFLSLAKGADSVKDFILKLRYDGTRTIFGTKQAGDSVGALSYFENLANYNGKYAGIGINRAFNHIGYGPGRKLTAKDNNALHQLMLDDNTKKFIHTDGVEYDIPKEVQEAYFGKKEIGLVGIKDIMDDIFEEGVKLGEFTPGQKVLNYFPRVFNYGALSKNQPRFKKLLKKYGTTDETTGKFTPYAATDADADAIVKDMLDLRYSQFDVKPKGSGTRSFQQHRVFSEIPDEELGFFLDNTGSSFVSNNVMEVLSEYVGSVAQLYARKKTFGVRNIEQFENTTLKNIKDELKLLGASDEQIATTANGITKLFGEVTGLSGKGLAPEGPLGRAANIASESVRLLQQAAHLTFAVPSSITEPLLMFQRVGLRDYPRVVHNIAQGIWKEITKNTDQLYQLGKARLGLGKAKFKDLDDEYWQELYAGGMAIENNILEGLDRLASGERFYNKGLRATSDAFFKMNLLTQWTRAVQGAAFTSGKLLIRRNLQKLYDHKLGVAKLTEGDFRGLGMNKKEYLEKQLQELGIDPEEGMAWYRSSLDDNLDFNVNKSEQSPFYKEKYLEGAKRFTNETILNPNRAAAAKSILMQSGWGKLAFQFMSYPTLFNNVVIKRMLNELREYPVQTSPKLLITGFLMTSIAMQMNLLRNPERHTKMSDEENILEAAERWGALAQGSMVKRTAEAAKYGSGFTGSLTRGVFGPSVGDALDSIEYKLGPTSIVARNVPFSQVIKRLEPEKYKEFQTWAKEMDESYFGLIDDETSYQEYSSYRTGGLVTNVPNASPEPEKRVNKMTGVPYDIEAGPSAQPEKTRAGLSEEGKLLATLARRQKLSEGGQPQSYQDILFNFIAQAEDAKLYERMLKGENPELTAYLPTPNDVQTIGFGRTRGVTKDTKSTLEEEKNKLREELELFERETIKSIGQKRFDSLNNNQKAAVVSLIFNVGRSAFDGTNAQKAIKAGDLDTFMKEAFDPQLGFTKQRNADGQLEILEGLQNRRQAEKDLFLRN